MLFQFAEAYVNHGSHRKFPSDYEISRCYNYFALQSSELPLVVAQVSRSLAALVLRQ